MDRLFSNFDHICIVVRDLDKAIEHYQSLGIGPFVPGKQLKAKSEEYLGNPVDPDALNLKARFAKMGSIELELIQPIAEGTVWKDFLDRMGEGVHHMCFIVDDIDEAEREVVGRGFSQILKRLYKKGGGTGYFATEQVGGIFLQLTQPPPN